MNLGLKEQLEQWKKDHQEVKQERKKEKTPQRKPEKLSERGWKEIIGMDRARYGRARGGAFRQE